MENWEVRFWAKVDKAGPTPADKPELGPCWVWVAATCKGYGRFKYNGKMVTAHKLIYEKLVSVVPSGQQLDHLCRNKKCVNYAKHLEPVTASVNVLRGRLNPWEWEEHAEAIG